MALHRDIYWVGRQWAVTGYGMQAVDQKLKGEFDIEADRLWDDDLLERMHAHKWFNAEDFGKGLAIARARYPRPSTRQASPMEPSVSRPEASIPVEPPKSVPPIFEMRVRGWPAKFVGIWRVGVRR
jgi:hypothetical protein